tara:strand:- start:3814 stop:4710 length:897 start_codon:yes stop_codon:yes gene_type:complete
MKIIITGSLGNIGKQLIPLLNSKEHQITVISSNIERQKDIETLGANAKIGSLEDLDFLIEAFADSDIAYCMIPPNDYFNQNLDLIAYYEKVANNYATAISKSNIKQVVYLSSVSGHMESGNGILQGHSRGEKIIKTLPNDIHISILRPVEYYYNLFGQIASIKNNNIMASVFSGDVVNAWVSPKDIATVIAEEIEKGIVGRKVRYIAGEEITYNELTKTIGEAINKPNLAWVQITPLELEQVLKEAGLNPNIAEGLVEMCVAINTGLLYEDYNKNKPTTFGKIKVKDFAKEFAQVYNA